MIIFDYLLFIAFRTEPERWLRLPIGSITFSEGLLPNTDRYQRVALLE